MTSIPLWLSDAHPCSYLPDQTSRSAVVNPSVELTMELYTELVRLGFRRSGNQVYKPYCNTCQACIPSRIQVADFIGNRSQRRCQQSHRDTRVVIKPAHFNQQHFDLYCRYQNSRHDTQTIQHSEAEYWQFLGSDWCETWFVEFHQQHHLMAVAVVDQLANGLSAVYTFFDPQYAASSPGVYAVLWQIEHARKLGLDYVYLGFWIEDCRKMRYKIQYQPLQGLIDGQWRLLPVNSPL